MSALLRAIAWLARLPSERTVTRIATLLGLVWFHVIRYRRRVMAENLRTAFPEATEAERRRIARGACIHMARSALEVFRIPLYARIGLDKVVRAVDLDNYWAAHEKGRGVLCLSGHLGSFEVIAAAMAARLKPNRINVVVKSFPPALNGLLTEIREATGLRLIPAKGGMKAILEELREGGTVIFVLDQNATRRLGVFVDFFGKPACTMSGLATIARRTGAPVMAAAAVRHPDGHAVHVFPEIPFEDDVPDPITHMTQRYTRFIEDRIKEHPEQWLWSHKRWKTQPD